MPVHMVMEASERKSENILSCLNFFIKTRPSSEQAPLLGAEALSHTATSESTEHSQDSDSEQVRL